jgi:hypothetical protein
MAISAIVAKPYRLQTNDVLSINIKAIDPKLVAIFSTTNEEILLNQHWIVFWWFYGRWSWEYQDACPRRA